MCISHRETTERPNGEEGLTVGRRQAILGAACLVLAGTLPGGGLAFASAGGRGRAAGAQRPRQSPIDLRRNRITFVRRLSRIDFEYPRRVDVTLVNTGSPDEFATVRAEVPPGAAHIVLDGVRWDLDQFHWHTPSEHEVEGRSRPLEMHLVHTRADEAILVIAVFIERGSANAALAPMFSDLPAEPNATRDVSDVRLRGLLPERRKSFRYKGSLTTPPFTEPVRFVVLADSISASKRQIGAFRELFAEGNSREVQPLNGRKIRGEA